MCYHISLAAGPAELAARYGRKADLIERFKPLYHVSAFSYPEYPVVTSDLEIELFRWGLIPFWADELEDAFELRYRTFNARAETVFTKPAFRKPIRRTRCLVPVTGFFEWRHEDDRRIPYYVAPAGGGICSLAGVYDMWRNRDTGEQVETFAIITTEADALMRSIDNVNGRMPVILTGRQQQRWLDPSLDEEAVRSLLEPLTDGLLRAETIDNGFLKKSPDDPTILQPRTESAQA